MITKVTLYPHDNTLAGKYHASADRVYVLLDTTNAGFAVQLADLKNGNQNEIVFKNIGTNTARIQAATGQYIDNMLYVDIGPWDLVQLWSDLDKRWLMFNSYNTIGNTLVYK